MEDNTKDRYKNRRRMAWLSFVFMSMTGIYALESGMSSDEMQNRVVGLLGLIMALFSVWGGIIGAYFGVTFGTDRMEISQEPYAGRTRVTGAAAPIAQARVARGKTDQASQPEEG